MAQFHIGQRVRFIAIGTRVPVGSEGTICLPLGLHEGRRTEELRYGVEIDGCPCPGEPGTHWLCLPESLAPLTDPRASEFIADMERFAHVAKTTKVPA